MHQADHLEIQRHQADATQADAGGAGGGGLLKIASRPVYMAARGAFKQPAFAKQSAKQESLHLWFSAGSDAHRGGCSHRRFRPCLGARRS